MGLDRDEVYTLVERIPYGKVATYGQIAKLAGWPKNARQVGRLLAQIPESRKLPWHRVINAQGKISQRRKPGYTDYQRLLLEEEGVKFSAADTISFAHYQWSPSSS